MSLDPLALAALERARGVPITAKNIERLATTLQNTELARWAFLQWELRERGRAKFERADQMLFTREALEQSTREEIARYHASRFPTGARVFDLTTGIGGDLIALANGRSATGFERNPERADLARHNVAAYGNHADVLEADSLQGEWPGYAFADPSRRVEGRRTLDLDAFEPSPRQLAKRMADQELGGIKLTPLLADRTLEELGPELAFVASEHECPEVVVWCGRQSSPGRYAIWADTHERLEAGEAPPHAEEPEGYLFEAHPAAIRAHALGTLCDHFGLAGLGDSNGYLTGPTLVQSRWLKPYRVLGPSMRDQRQVAKALREMGCGKPVVKARAHLDVTLLTKALRSSAGSEEGAVAVYPVGKSLRFALLKIENPA